MKVQTSWLQQWLCRTISEHEIVQALERAGLEIEQYNSSKPLHRNIVVGLVKKVVQHEQAERLRVCEVEVGGKTLQIVCGAPNVRAGLKVAVAQVGTTLPGGDTITSVKLRGEVSEGMICSEWELGLGEDHNGILELPDSSKVNTPLCDMYPADGLVDVKTHANRFDLLSVVGLAREVGAMTDTPLQELPSVELPKAAIEKMLAGKPLARRYLLARFAVRPAALSPSGMAPRLRAAGMRPISGLVDATNYGMLELGQPVHAFDSAKVRLPVEVRLAKADECLTTLDGVARKLTAQDLVIADTTGPIALAGVMGGAATEVSETTSEILVEVASFDASLVRKMAKRHGLRSEASARMERELPTELVPIALNHLAKLLGEVADAKLVAFDDTGAPKAKSQPVTLPLEQLQRLTALDVTAKAAATALGRLGIPAHATTTPSPSVSVASVPWWRPDVTMAEDLVEEIVRVIGYDRVPSRLPIWRPSSLNFDHDRARLARLRQLLYGAGLFEVLTYSFVAEDQLTELGLGLDSELRLKNPLTSEQGYLRSSLLPSHLSVLERNRLYSRRFGFYELSSVFMPTRAGQQPDEPLQLGLMVVRPKDAYACAKGLLDAIGQSYNLNLSVAASETPAYAAGRVGKVGLDGVTVGTIGQIDPALLQRRKVMGEAAYLNLSLAPLLAAEQPVQYTATSRFPAIQRDIAIVIPAEIAWAEVQSALVDQAQVETNYVSEYYGDDLPAGHKSLALRLTLSHPDRTPTDAEAAELEHRVLAFLTRKFGATRR